jgi:hypothetical protein
MGADSSMERKAGLQTGAKARAEVPETGDDGAPNNFKDAIQEMTRVVAALATFDYTTEEWAKVAASLRPLSAADPQMIEKVRLHLVRSARSYFLQMANGPGKKQQKKWRLKHWTKVKNLADALMSEFFWLKRDSLAHGPPDPSGRERHPYQEQLLALMEISEMAAHHTTNRNTTNRNTTNRKRIDDGYPEGTLKSWYQFAVLEVWTELGGKLKISRHPIKGKIKGPLVKYFSAVTEPVHGGSPESLPDIIKRHEALKAARDKYRLDYANADAEP